MRPITRLALLFTIVAALLCACNASAAINFFRDDSSSQTPAPTDTQSAPGSDHSSDTSAQAAIRVVVQRGNFQQEQAFATHDPTVMKESATDRYYRDMAQTNQDLADNKVASIKLVGMEWGPVTVRGNAAIATTYETWSTTLADGSTQESRDRNDYRLIRQNGTWKIDGDSHLDPGTAPAGSRQV